jgi:hypothetical protein
MNHRLSWQHEQSAYRIGSLKSSPGFDRSSLLTDLGAMNYRFWRFT